MLKVAWPAFADSRWTGGLNYFRNLALAVKSIPNPRIEIILLNSGEHLPPPLDSLSCLDIPWPPRYSFRWLREALLRRYGKSGGSLAAYLKANRVDLLAYGPPLGEKSPVPALCWIADFQDIHLPHFFTDKERRARTIFHARVAKKAQGVILSSHSAHADFCRLFPKAAHKAHVLQFVASVPPEDKLPPTRTVLAAHEINEPYFHVPNQIWAHKNHQIIVKALHILLQEEGSCPLVVSTGQTNDYRNPDFFAQLRKEVETKGLADRLRFLGLVPFEYLAALMRGSVALINPSRFEGWSTTVEEAKSLGKKILLSDLPVHREQAPSRGMFFDCDDAQTLAALMRQSIQVYDATEESRAMQTAAADLPIRIRAYGEAYERLALRIIEKLG